MHIMKYFKYFIFWSGHGVLTPAMGSTNIMYVGCKVWNTANILCLWAQLTTTVEEQSMCNDGVACRGTTASSETAGVATEK